MTTGYSAQPLAGELSLENGLRAWWCTMPDKFRAETGREGPAGDSVDRLKLVIRKELRTA